MSMDSEGRLFSSSVMEPREDDLEEGEDVKDGTEEEEEENEV